MIVSYRSVKAPILNRQRRIKRGYQKVSHSLAIRRLHSFKVCYPNKEPLKAEVTHPSISDSITPDGLSVESEFHANVDEDMAMRVLWCEVCSS